LRKTPRELNEARRKKQAERQAAELAAREARAMAKSRYEELESKRPKYNLVHNVLDGLYDEIEKLTKKAPADQVTELALRRVNALIKEAKELLKGDPFIDTIDVFVAAGDNPENRDVLLILREIRQGLKRQNSEYLEFD
jgi:hypothetical protein